MKKTDDRSYYKNLPRKRMAAGVLLFNEKNELLIVKPNYRDYWLLPGGIVEENESPRAAAIRELKEEIGLDIDADRLEFAAVDYSRIDKVDYNYKDSGEYEGVQFVFDGGLLSKEMVGKIILQKEELEEYKFAPIEEALSLLNAYLSKRVSMAMAGLKDAKPVYLENGEAA